MAVDVLVETLIRRPRAEVASLIRRATTADLAKLKALLERGVEATPRI